VLNWEDAVLIWKDAVLKKGKDFGWQAATDYFPAAFVGADSSVM
jgi:hypothetical protein